MTTKADITINRLIDDGWTISHTATHTSYLPAGTITPMQTRKGVDYCRVHHGKSARAHGFSYQVTTVMCKRVER